MGGDVMMRRFDPTSFTLFFRTDGLGWINGWRREDALCKHCFFVP
jgi:hypothetical protein